MPFRIIPRSAENPGTRPSKNVTHCESVNQSLSIDPFFFMVDGLCQSTFEIRCLNIQRINNKSRETQQLTSQQLLGCAGASVLENLVGMIPP